ncbi:MAG TPA: SDR family oxidoreductase [Bacteroidota bacterium]|nr:SDR family oxidoreductase [Bacteroidota bacterium]
MATYLITGGAGFIGSNIVGELVRKGESVRVLDNFSTGKRENLLPFNGRIEIIEGSLTDMETVKEAMGGIDYVLHEGALPSVPRSVEQPINSNDVNVGGTLNILVAARDEGVKRVVLASSSSVYGDTEVMPKVETMRPAPLSPYAVSKLTGELYARVFSQLYGLQTVVLRYFNVFGPRQNPDSQYSAVIPKFINAMIHGKRPTIFGDGLQSRDFSYVENVVDANLLSATAPPTNGEVLNIACQESHTLLDLVRVLNDLLGKHIEPEFKPTRQADVRHSLADISLAREVIGYKPKVRWEEGLQKTLVWYQQEWQRI